MRLVPALLLALTVAGPALGTSLDAARTGAEMGRLSVVQDYLDEGGAVDALDFRGSTLLIQAARTGQTEVVALLLARGANPAVRSGAGESAISLAAMNGHLDTVEAFITAKAPLEVPNAWSPLHYAAYMGHEAIVKRLLGAGAQVDARADNGATALMLAARGGYLAIVEQLLDAGADVCLRSDRGLTALGWALANDRAEVASRLRRAGAID